MRWMWSCVTALCLGVGSLPAQEAETVEIDGLKSKAPAAWKKAKPANAMQYASFTLPKVEGDPEDGQLIIFHFGPGGGGGVDANVKRWQQMFKAPAGEKSKTATMKVGDVKVTSVDVEGVYLSKFPPFDPNAKVTEKPHFRLIGVVFESPKGPYFMRVIGPTKTIEKHRAEFESWLKNFK